jgi:hypothetical protein
MMPARYGVLLMGIAALVVGAVWGLPVASRPFAEASVHDLVRMAIGSAWLIVGYVLVACAVSRWRR